MVIYKCTNKINGKIYVGKTKYSLNERVSQHKSESKCYKDYTLCAFHNALNKYGFENFSWEVIDTAETEEELNEKEKYWIEKLKSLTCYEKGYNISTGGEGRDNFTNHPNKEEVRKRVSEGVKNSKRWTPERKKEFSEWFKKNNPMKLHPENSFFKTNNPMKLEKNKRKGDKNPMANPVFRQKQKERISSPEVRQRISKGTSLALKGVKKTEQACINMARVRSKIYWVKYDIKTRELIEIYESFKEIPDKNKEKVRSLYPCNTEKGYRISNGYIWVNYWKNEITKEDIPTIFRESI